MPITLANSYTFLTMFSNNKLSRKQKSKLCEVITATFLDSIGLHVNPTFSWTNDSSFGGKDVLSFEVPTHLLIHAKMVVFAITKTLGLEKENKWCEIQ